MSGNIVRTQIEVNNIATFLKRRGLKDIKYDVPVPDMAHFKNAEKSEEKNMMIVTIGMISFILKQAGTTCSLSSPADLIKNVFLKVCLGKFL